ncbi:hypothetical protein D9M73_209290 [compost metagenome]
MPRLRNRVYSNPLLASALSRLRPRMPALASSRGFRGANGSVGTARDSRRSTGAINNTQSGKNTNRRSQDKSSGTSRY